MQASVFISGAAQGIGAEIARLFHKNGYKVGIYDINQELAEKLATELGENAKAGYLDVSNYRQWQIALQEFRNWAGELNILVNNAGILPKFDRFEHYSMADIEKAMNINFYSAVYSIHTLLPMILKSKTPGIINIDSSASLMSLAGTSVYSASKAALKSLSESLREELRGKCYVGIVCPGFTKTDIFRSQDASDAKGQKMLNAVSTSCDRMVKMIMHDIRTRRPLGVHGFDAAFMNYFGRLMPVLGGHIFSSVMKISKLPLFDPVFKD